LELNPKFQAPNNKQAPRPKTKIPNPALLKHLNLDFGIYLGFGF
jgi:hypothetical protein